VFFFDGLLFSICVCVQQVFRQNLYTVCTENSDCVDLMLNCRYKCRNRHCSHQLRMFCIFSTRYLCLL